VKPVVSTSPQTSNVEVGTSRKITCIVTSSLVHNVTWYKQGIAQPLTNQSKYKMDGNEMSILNVELSDAGNYYCVAQSAAGSSGDSSSSQVKTFSK